MIAVILDVIAISSQMPSGEGGSGRLRFLLRAGGWMIADGRKTSLLAVVWICVCIVFMGVN